MSWRAARRGTLLALMLCFCCLRFGAVWLGAMLKGRAVSTLERAQWMQFAGQRVLAALGIRYRIEGAPPSGVTLIVANHLSYLDIVIASAAVPCAFVAKLEIASWPGFGSLARLGGTIFLNRASHASARAVARCMADRMVDGVPVLLFPEGTSTDGHEVIRFHSTLFAPAVDARIPTTPTAIFYEPHHNSLVERDLCWFGDDAFLPHLLRVLAVDDFTAIVRFGTPEVYPDRQAAAWRAHDAVAAMREHRT